MIDGIIKADGTSRLMRATLPATYEEFRAQCAAGAQPLDVLFNAIGWSQMPTFLSKGNLASDNTLALFGLGTDAVPDDAFAKLSGLYLHTWRKRGAVLSATYGDAVSTVVCYAYTGNATTFTYGSGFDMDADGNVTLTGTGTFTYSQTGSEASDFNTLKGKYFYYHDQNGVTSGSLLYCVPSSPDATVSQNNWSLTCQTVTPYFEYEDEEYITSQDRNAYPDSGFVGGYEYQYLGIPFQNAVTAPKIATGSYIGTGVYTDAYYTQLNIGFKPKFVYIADATYQAFYSNDNMVSHGRFLWVDGVTQAEMYEYNGTTILEVPITDGVFKFRQYSTNSIATEVGINQSGVHYHWIAIG